MENYLSMRTKPKSELREKAKALINWSALSEQLAHNRDSIRAERYPKKYTDDIKELLSYVEAWLNCKELTTKEVLMQEIEFEVGNRLNELSTELRNIGKNPFNRT